MTWQPIETAPVNVPVQVKLTTGRKLVATLCPGAAMTTDEIDCDQWQALGDDYPNCWTDGCCWQVNEQGNASLQPMEWQPTKEPTQ